MAETVENAVEEHIAHAIVSTYRPFKGQSSFTGHYRGESWALKTSNSGSEAVEEVPKLVKVLKLHTEQKIKMLVLINYVRHQARRKDDKPQENVKVDACCWSEVISNSSCDPISKSINVAELFAEQRNKLFSNHLTEKWLIYIADQCTLLKSSAQNVKWLAALADFMDALIGKTLNYNVLNSKMQLIDRKIIRIGNKFRVRRRVERQASSEVLIRVREGDYVLTSLTSLPFGL